MENIFVIGVAYDKKDFIIIQLTGYFTDLSIYLVQDGKAYIAGERDNYHPVD